MSAFTAYKAVLSGVSLSLFVPNGIGDYAGRLVYMREGNRLKSITLTPAKILGIEDRLGTLEVGKDATLFISDGDALDMRSNNVMKAFIRGKDLDLDNVHSQLYRKYMTKYRLN